MKHIFLVVACLVLAACYHNPAPPVPPSLPPSAGLNIDKQLLEKCEDFPKLPTGKEADVVDWALDAKAKYKKCQVNHSGLVGSLKNSLNK